MTGITAGIEGRTSIGDILVADPSWDWGSGKIGIKDKDLFFFSAPHHLNLDVDIKSKIEAMASDHVLLSTIKQGFRFGSTPSESLRVHVGPVASGASVLQNNTVVESIKLQHRKLLGVEMEAYGVFSAAETCSKPRPTPIVFKSVCDFADIHKNDVYHPYAIYTSSMFFYNFMVNHL